MSTQQAASADGVRETKETAFGQSIASVLHGIVAESDARDIAAFQESRIGVDALAAAKNGDVAEFKRAVHTHQRALDGLLHLAWPQRDQFRIRFLFGNLAFVDNHIRALFVAREGSCCCADKTRAVIRQLVGFLNGGPNISFAGIVSYARPQRVLSTHEDVLSFFDALLHLHAGRPERYLENMAAMNALSAEDSQPRPEPSA